MAAHSSNMPASADTAGSVPKHGVMHSIDWQEFGVLEMCHAAMVLLRHEACPRQAWSSPQCCHTLGHSFAMQLAHCSGPAQLPRPFGKIGTTEFTTLLLTSTAYVIDSLTDSVQCHEPPIRGAVDSPGLGCCIS